MNKKDVNQHTPLSCAAIVGSFEIIDLLLTHQANVNAQHKRGGTALDFAKFNNMQLPEEEIDKIVELLISYGAKTQSELLNS